MNSSRSADFRPAAMASHLVRKTSAEGPRLRERARTHRRFAFGAQDCGQGALAAPLCQLVAIRRSQ